MGSGNGKADPDRQRLWDLEELCHEEFPGFRIDYKDTSKDWKIRLAKGVVGSFNSDFDTMTTTLYPVVYFPNRDFVEKSPSRAFHVLAHEYVHLKDEKRVRGDAWWRKPWFGVSYLFPQVLAVFGLLSLLAIPGSLSWLWCLLFFGFLAPLPAYWRYRWEMRGYTMNMRMEFLKYGRVSDAHMSRIVETFTGWKYYKMWPFSRAMERVVREAAENVQTGKLGEVYQQVDKIYRSH